MATRNEDINAWWNQNGGCVCIPMVLLGFGLIDAAAFSIAWQAGAAVLGAGLIFIGWRLW